MGEITRKPHTERQVRRSMTIAAGINCSDGILICADTEHTGPSSKIQKPKVFQAANQKIIVTGCNAADYIKVGYDKFCERLQAGPEPADPLQARAMVEEVTAKMYEHHIIPFQATDPTLSVDFIVALRCTNDQLCLIKTINSTAAIIDSDPFVVLGSGSEFFNYWATYFFYRMRLNMELASHVVAFMLREIKTAGINCGGNTFITKMPRHLATADPKGYLFREKKVLAEFPQSAVDVLFAAMDLRQTDSYLDQKIEDMKKLAVELRSYIKRQDQRLTGIYTATANTAVFSDELEERDN
jgi:20S proteasome alpha/beta subunit